MDLEKNCISETVKTIHLIAACGTAMGALACILKESGYRVTGSDQDVYPTSLVHFDHYPPGAKLTALCDLADELRANGISLVMDLVLNHVAREHEWARRARDGEQRYRDYFYVYPDRTVPDQYERTLPEVFPDFAPGSFTYDADLDGWVWTTFNSFQWDLNYSNTEVMRAMMEEMLYLANQGLKYSGSTLFHLFGNGWEPIVKISLKPTRLFGPSTPWRKSRHPVSF